MKKIDYKKLLKIAIIYACATLLLSLILFICFCFAITLEVGSLGSAINTYGFFFLMLEFIKELALPALLYSAIIVLILFIVYFCILKWWNSFKQKRLSPCPYCKKLFAMKYKSSKLIEEKDIAITVELKDRNSQGYVIGTHEGLVPGQLKVYEYTYVCKYCNYETVKKVKKRVAN